MYFCIKEINELFIFILFEIFTIVRFNFFLHQKQTNEFLPLQEDNLL